MKTIGLIGGTSWVSTVDYYRVINERINERLGGLNSSKLFLYSINYEEFKPPVDPLAWGPLEEFLSDIAKKLEIAGAECIVLCANTPHMAAEAIQKSIGIPLLHIADATAKAIAKSKTKRVALLGTRITMEQEFFKKRLLANGIEAIIPGDADREFMHRTIFAELGKGIFKKETKERYLRIINDMEKQGAGGVIFACTEIPMLIKNEESSLPVFDTLLIHTEAAVDFALE